MITLVKNFPSGCARDKFFRLVGSVLLGFLSPFCEQATFYIYGRSLVCIFQLYDLNVVYSNFDLNIGVLISKMNAFFDRRTGLILK